ncbi:MAG: branched-chain amino acid ABC transporter permease [Anaerolineae bacterium]
MSNPIKAGLAIGIAGGLVIAFFGGLSGILAALVGGASVGLILSSWEHFSKADVAVRKSAIAGAIAGALMVVGQLIYQFVIVPLSGQTSVVMDMFTWIIAILTFVICLVLAMFIGYTSTLELRRRRIALFGLLIVFLLIYPFLDSGMSVLYKTNPADNPFVGQPLINQGLNLNWLGTMITILTFVVLALGLNIVVGYAGLLDLGYAAFFAIGAYTTGLLYSPYISSQVGADWPWLQFVWTFWLVIWVAAAVAAVFGLILGSPTIPLRGDYLAIVTLGFGEIVPIVFRNLTAVTLTLPFTSICIVGCVKPLNFTGGESGVNPIGRPWLPLITYFQTGDYLPWYFLILAIIALTVFLINRLYQSRLGRAWTALREDELAAAAMGINTTNTKLMAFAMGATFSGFAGAFYGSYIGAIFPSVFDFTVSVIILVMVIFGGLGNMLGVIVGGMIIMMADRLLLPQIAGTLKAIINTTVVPTIQDPQMQEFVKTSVDPLQWRQLLFGLTLVVMMLVRPEGLIPSARRRAELHSQAPTGTEPLSILEADQASGLMSVDSDPLDAPSQ